MMWKELSEQERADLSAVNVDEECFNAYDEQGRLTLLNIYYLLKSSRVAGNLWPQVRSVLWAGCNQIGVEVADVATFRSSFEDSGNFTHDSLLTLLVKKSEWSLRQTLIDGQAVTRYGLQVYRRNAPSVPNELVLDIDAIVLSGLSSIPRHILDVLKPDPTLNDPVKAREEIVARGLLPDRAGDEIA